jgi:hypothetical protein
MAAAARAPGPADARIPCPLCGGLIHPIAGRCKHCKEDLSTLRSSRPAAAATLPSLLGSGARANPYVGAATTNGAGPVAQLHAQAVHSHPANAHLAVPIAVRTEEPSQPILPPRPTGRMHASQPGPVTWKSWPVIVIAIAVVAIVTAVVLMVWPPGATTKANAGTLPPPPAPERMDTNPLPPSGGGPQSGVDPWRAPPGAAPDPAPTRPAPSPSPGPSPGSPDIDDIDPDDPGSLRDPFGSPRPGRGGGLGGLGSLGGANSVAMMAAIFHKACDRLASCGTADPLMKSTCEALDLSLPNQPPPSCPAAQRCLATIDRMSCDDDMDATALMGLMTSVQDCMTAMNC